MRNGQKIDLGMTGYAELFMTDEERKTQTLPRIVDIPIEMTTLHRITIIDAGTLNFVNARFKRIRIAKL